MVDRNAIRDGMEVIAADGELVGTAAGIDGARLRIRHTGGSDRDSVPLEWVSRVDEHVHLVHGGPVARAEWEGAAARPRRTEGRARGPWIIGLVLIVIVLVLLIWGFVYNFQGATRPSDEVVPAARVSIEDPAAAARG